jgi:hypothetical protein
MLNGGIGSSCLLKQELVLNEEKNLFQKQNKGWRRKGKGKDNRKEKKATCCAHLQGRYEFVSARLRKTNIKCFL